MDAIAPGIVAGWSVLSKAERRARLRALQACVRMLCGPRMAVIDDLRRAESDPARLAACDAGMDALPTLRMRNVWRTWATTLPENEA